MAKAALIDPLDIEPMSIDSEFHRSGAAVHRRLISKAAHGSEKMDAGYNNYAAGLEFQGLEQTVDGICYIVAGEGELELDGRKMPVSAGMVIFQPKGSVMGLKCHTDMASLCIFSPPRQ